MMDKICSEYQNGDICTDDDFDMDPTPVKLVLMVLFAATGLAVMTIVVKVAVLPWAE